jgi:hypothetical protein
VAGFKTLLDTKPSPVLIRAMPSMLEKAAELGIKVEKETGGVAKFANEARKTWFPALSTTSGSPIYF